MNPTSPMSSGTPFNFNPKSPNAMFAVILARLDEQDRTSATERKLIKDAIADAKTENIVRHNQHEARIAQVEHFVITHKAKVAILVVIGSGAVSFIAWLIQFAKK